MTRRRSIDLAMVSACCLALLACAGDAAHATPDSSMASPDDSGAPRPESYAAVVEILERSCAYVRCHSGTPVGGALSFLRGANHALSLVDVPACEYELMKRVEPFHPERSWLIVKLTAAFRPASDPYANYIYFDPEPGWDPNQRGCRDETDEGTPLFGSRMPLTAPNMLPDEELETLRGWIAEGAPH
jgi:hypothetical protein